jgi:hypothetical protein
LNTDITLEQASRDLLDALDALFENDFGGVEAGFAEAVDIFRAVAVVDYLLENKK